MKIALIHLRHRETGGTERYLQQLAGFLAERGHDVSIVCRSHERPPHPAVHFVVLRDAAVGAAWRMWAFARAVERHVTANHYDLVFALGKTWPHDVIWLGGGCHQTYLDLAHRATLRPWTRWLGKGQLQQRIALALEARALHSPRLARVITNSEMVKQDVVRRHGIAPERVTVIYNGVDLNRFHPTRHRDAGAALRAACGFERDDFVVLFLGTGYGRKGLGRLLEAFPAVLAARPRARLMVIGYDSSQAAFERQAARLGLGERVRFLGGRRDPEVGFAAADLYVLPTYYDPAAYSTVEALASGLPVVTTTTNGASEILTHRVSGSILRTEESAELAGEVLFWSEGGRAHKARAGARAVAEPYAESSMMLVTATLLETVAGERQATSRS